MGVRGCKCTWQGQAILLYAPIFPSCFLSLSPHAHLTLASGVPSDCPTQSIPPEVLHSTWRCYPLPIASPRGILKPNATSPSPKASKGSKASLRFSGSDDFFCPPEGLTSLSEGHSGHTCLLQLSDQCANFGIVTECHERVMPRRGGCWHSTITPKPGIWGISPPQVHH